MNRKTILAIALLAESAMTSLAMAQQAPLPDVEAAQRQAEATLERMTADEKVILTHGIMALPYRIEPAGMS